MNRFVLLLPLCAPFVYAPAANAYNTSLTVTASANAAYGSPSYDSDFKVIDNVNGPSAYAVDALYQVPDPRSGPGSNLETYRSSASGFVSAGILKATANASATAYAANVASGSSKVSFSDHFSVAGPSGRNIDLTLTYLVSGGLSGSATARGSVQLGTGDSISFSENGYTPRSFNCSWTPSCTGVATFSVPVNTLISLDAFLEVGASASSYFKPTATQSSANFGSTGLVYLGIADNRYQLLTDSGYGYAPVPLPAAVWLFAGGLALFGTLVSDKRRVTQAL
ncbi:MULTISPECIES: hypothetical protein [Methylomonas]|uniref:PEP-CTERM protein-sorting domain-containing protein n=1 Tax=Methylomonas koyamae TaxID=702114 RepID=A0A177NAN3_9GAMM|nr:MULTISPECIES: hypothetical protein [Methylomonas]MDT4328947.1 hypothetical protein [Methylomonas sp. MV1]OAI14891.1 hypothetical protein A1355_11465 [Methylomonas koyamae]